MGETEMHVQIPGYPGPGVQKLGSQNSEHQPSKVKMIPENSFSLALKYEAQAGTGSGVALPSGPLGVVHLEGERNRPSAFAQVTLVECFLMMMMKSWNEFRGGL